MALSERLLEEGSTNDVRLEQNTSSTDELAGVSALERGTMEVLIIQTLERFIGPIIVPVIMPLIRQVIEEQIGLAKQEIMASMKENLTNKGITSGPKKLKLQFRNKVSLPAYTGKRLIGENETSIEIALTDAITGKIVNTGPESMAKLEIVGFRVGDHDSWTVEDFQERILSEKKGKRTLQGNTCLQLKEGVCFISNIHFTHTSKNNKNGLFRLGAGVVDAALMNGVEVARTEAFPMKDGRALYSEKHPHPHLSDKVCHLEQIDYTGNRYKRLKKAKVHIVKDLLTLFYTDPKRLEDILKLKASSKNWDDIVKNAQASNGMFLYLDPINEPKSGVVLNAKLELKAFIEESHQYIPVNQLSDKQKVDSQNLLSIATERLGMLRVFEDETGIKEYLQGGISFNSLPSANQGLGTYKITDGPPRPSHVTYSSPGLTEAQNTFNNTNFHMGQNMNRAPVVTSQSEQGKHKVPFDDVMIYSTDYYHEHILSHLATMEGPSRHSFGNATEPGASSQAVGPLDAFGLMKPHDIFSQDQEEFEELQHDKNSYYLFENLSNEWHSNSVNSDVDVVTMATQTVFAGTRWRNASKLLRPIITFISLSQGIQAHKKQRRC